MKQNHIIRAQRVSRNSYAFARQLYEQGDLFLARYWQESAAAWSRETRKRMNAESAELRAAKALS